MNILSCEQHTLNQDSLGKLCFVAAPISTGAVVFGAFFAPSCSGCGGNVNNVKKSFPQPFRLYGKSHRWYLQLHTDGQCCGSVHGVFVLFFHCCHTTSGCLPACCKWTMQSADVSTPIVEEAGIYRLNMNETFLFGKTTKFIPAAAAAATVGSENILCHSILPSCSLLPTQRSTTHPPARVSSLFYLNFV